MKRLLPILLLTTLAFVCAATPALAADATLVLDEEPVREGPPVRIADGRTLVPLRLVSERLGADVRWDNTWKKVEIERGGRVADMRIDDHLAAYDRGAGRYEIIDVAPRLLDVDGETRTYVPLRLVANVLDVSIGWEADTKTVRIDSSSPATPVPFFSFGFAGASDGDIIRSARTLRLIDAQGYAAKAAQVRFLLVDPTTHRGRVVAAGRDLDAGYELLPRATDQGASLLCAVLVDADGDFVAGAVKPVTLSVDPRTELKGAADGQRLTDAVELSCEHNFAPAYVKYQFTNRDTGKSELSEPSDPYGPYSWRPEPADNGETIVRVIAYDALDKGTLSDTVQVVVDVERALSLRGVSEGQTIRGQATLNVRRNFPVSATEYWRRDPRTGEETLIARLGYGSHTWRPDLSLAGEWDLFTRVYDVRSQAVDSEPIRVRVSGEPWIAFSGAGPDAVISEAIELKALTNVPFEAVTFLLAGSSGTQEIAAQDGSATLAPSAYATGDYRLSVRGRYDDATYRSEEVPVRLYNGTLHGAEPLVPKDQFMGVVQELALDSQKRTGMSAALQTAQAILETGWGQYIPVDKYSGKFSYNLFGIKGSASNGSVVSNTWEEYNGVAFRVDASFRAYRNVEESWADHKRILLELSRYQIYRDVMYDPVRGAYAVRRAGYATDSRYPAKLIDIIERYDLWTLDQVGI